mgnify:CR=1 FL=1
MKNSQEGGKSEQTKNKSGPGWQSRTCYLSYQSQGSTGCIPFEVIILMIVMFPIYYQNLNLFPIITLFLDKLRQEM